LGLSTYRLRSVEQQGGDVKTAVASLANVHAICGVLPCSSAGFLSLYPAISTAGCVRAAGRNGRNRRGQDLRSRHATRSSGLSAHGFHRHDAFSCACRGFPRLRASCGVRACCPRSTPILTDSHAMPNRDDERFKVTAPLPFAPRPRTEVLKQVQWPPTGRADTSIHRAPVASGSPDWS
jgi:hypothetical protein